MKIRVAYEQSFKLRSAHTPSSPSSKLHLRHLPLAPPSTTDGFYFTRPSVRYHLIVSKFKSAAFDVGPGFASRILLVISHVLLVGYLFITVTHLISFPAFFFAV